MLNLLKHGDSLNSEALAERDYTGPGGDTDEAIQIVHQVCQKIEDRYGKEGLDKTIKMIRAGRNDSLKRYAERNWR